MISSRFREASRLLFGVLNKDEVGGGFAEMKDNAPVEIEPAEMGLKGGAISCIDTVCQGSDEDGAGVGDDKTAHRDVWMIENGDGWIQVNFRTFGLDRGPDQAFPCRLSIT